MDRNDAAGFASDSLEVAQPPVSLLHAVLAGDLWRTLWQGVPALTWVMNQADGQLHVRGGQGDAAVATAPVAALGRLLREILRDDGPGPMQLLEALPFLDGSLHSFLIIGYPVGATEGGSQAYLAGVAIDVTRHQVHIDQLAHQALVDELTCVYNLRGFVMFAEHELKVARRRRTVSAVVYVDVDGLKAVNDSRGHAAGNAMLAGTATLLRRVFRDCDVVGRLGGDEFAVFAADVRGDPAQLGERLRAEVRAAGRGTGDAAGLAASVGVAACAAGDGMTLSQLLAAADRAMYQDRDKRRRRAVRPMGTGPRRTST